MLENIRRDQKLRDLPVSHEGALSPEKAANAARPGGPSIKAVQRKRLEVPDLSITCDWGRDVGAEWGAEKCFALSCRKYKWRFPYALCSGANLLRLRVRREMNEISIFNH
ncbi:MAG: hypothetical protein JXR29_12545 [Methylothermaceae bacterium]|nr:hypothetical protein [Methylothermaceae bacterium]